MSAKVLLSIKPEFVEQIILGNKCFEYRRVLYKRTDIKRIVVYASSPVCRIVGEIAVGNLLTDTPKALWERTKDKAGISEDFFLSAFHPYRTPEKLSDKYPNTSPPQSFCYL